MRVLWLCNIIIPRVSDALGIKKTPIGGWLTGLSEDLLDDGIEMVVCFPMKGKKEIIYGEAGGLHYCGFPKTRNVEGYFEEILKKYKPDVIHVFGTEYKHSSDMIRVCNKMGMGDKTVISIQGLVSVYYRHYYAGLPFKAIHSCTLRDVLKRDNIYFAAKNFKKRGKYEIEAIKGTRHITGRTDWDKACTEQVNPKAKYHFCNETLRSSFYEYVWDIDKCEKYSIFLSQGGYPIKGLHLMLEAMPMILRKFPQAHIYITGTNPLKFGFKKKLKQSYYTKYIGKLIKKFGLEGNITFLGSLDEKQMCERYLKSHVFVSASSIENSPNSVGEAMILGIPTVSSDVGGVKNMLTHGLEGFVYPCDESYMIAHYVCRIFENDELALKFSQNARDHAQKTHNRKDNLETMLEIYKEIGEKY